MSKTTQTTRRAFLKSGALVAVPSVAIGIPGAAMAEDGSKAALARLQDERAIEALGRDFVRVFNRGGAQDAVSPSLQGVTKLSLDHAEGAHSLAFAPDGTSATARFDCTAEVAEELVGNATIVQMARLQGNAASSQTVRKTLSAYYARYADGWRIASIDLA
jgi:hypothetical protein